MLQKIFQEAKGNRREYVANLMMNLFDRSVAYGGASICVAPGTNALKIKISKSTTDLQRFKTLSFASNYLYLKDASQVYPLDQMVED